MCFRNRKHLLLGNVAGGADYWHLFSMGGEALISWDPLAVTLLSLQCSPSIPHPPAYQQKTARQPLMYFASALSEKSDGYFCVIIHPGPKPSDDVIEFMI